MDIGQTEVTALVSICQTLVVEPQLVEDCGLKVVNVYLIFDHIVTDLIRLPVDATRFYAGPGHPHGIGVNVVISADSFAGFAHRGSAKFSTPDD